MLTYLLDTNVCIELLRGRRLDVRRRFVDAHAANHVLLLSSIVVAELWYGVAKSAARERNARALQWLVNGPMRWAQFDDADAHEAGVIRADLERAGTLIGAHDLLIAGQAIRHGATLVTANTREFGRVEDLMWEDWAAPMQDPPA